MDVSVAMSISFPGFGCYSHQWSEYGDVSSFCLWGVRFHFFDFPSHRPKAEMAPRWGQIFSANHWRQHFGGRGSGRAVRFWRIPNRSQGASSSRLIFGIVQAGPVLYSRFSVNQARRSGLSENTSHDIAPSPRVRNPDAGRLEQRRFRSSGPLDALCLRRIASARAPISAARTP